MKSKIVMVCALAAAAALTANAWAQTPMRVVAGDLNNNSKGFAGRFSMTEAPTGVLITVEVQGLAPGWHGMHLHEKGDCSAADFTSAGGHMNHPTTKKAHGLLNPGGPDFGDLPNIYVSADGSGKAEAFTTLVKMSDLKDADGSAIVIHANKDDHSAQPIGGAGARVACGVIR
ncbi:MAG TPA: superoxide dismutase family protein [Caulobacteraceae bacterium]|nr:superoxide dismutase family protein [Caulobacteraceae bacterium]